MNISKACIIGCAKDIGKHLPATLQKMASIRKLFHEDSIIVIAENDSVDNTKAILTEWKTNNPFTTILNYDGKIWKFKHRTEKLAYLRNELMKYVHKHYSSYDYIIICDMDDVLHGLDINNIVRVFEEIKDPWDAIFPNCEGLYYDIWALRAPSLGIDYDCWDAINHNTAAGIPYQKAKQENVTKFQVQLPKEGPLIPVKSAFAGLAIYKLRATRGCDYFGLTSNCSCKQIKSKIIECRQDTCEHVSFHIDMMRKGCKLYICPFLLTQTQQEHI